jgi:type III restriction enzyme
MSDSPAQADRFFTQPILNSPYVQPAQHWELDASGQPTLQIIPKRRPASFVTPIPKPKKARRRGQGELELDKTIPGADGKQKYDQTSLINEIRSHVDIWRALPEASWSVTPETAQLLRHWRSFPFSNQRPFFCQIEAVEVAIWLTEVARMTEGGKRILAFLASANRDAYEENTDLATILPRVCFKLATGAGKTTVMAMIIAWQAINAARRPTSDHYTRGFLLVAPGLTIRDRLRVLQPNDPDNYYERREIVPQDLMGDVKRAKIVITNYHSFKLRERVELSAGGRALLKGRNGEDLNTLESEGQMIQRVMPDLMGLKNIVVINDEAHHCYREKPAEEDDAELDGEQAKEAEKQNKAARLWAAGLEAVKRKLGLRAVYDLSATPFFINGSGYAEGTLFPWTMSDFSLMDAIECGIVKLPRVPVAENIANEEMPKYRDLWVNIRKDMPKKNRGDAEGLDPLKLPAMLQTAMESLYGHYEKTFRLWEERKIGVPPCFIIVCQNTSISKLVYDFVSGHYKQKSDGTEQLEHGRLPLFNNFDENTGNPLPRLNTLLIDSEQLDSGEAIDPDFRKMFSGEIERFRRDIVERTGNPRAAESITDEELLREVMNTVGKPGQLGSGIRCVVSVSMLTEGWDANTVTHVLGIRAFGTQLLCEQVIGRALRRQSYALNSEGLYDVEYADVFGIPFDFTAKPVVAVPKPPKPIIQVKAISPDRDALEIKFPRVKGYRVDLPEDNLKATFNEDSTLVLTPDLVGPTITQNKGIIGQDVNMTVDHLRDVRHSTVIYRLTSRLLETKYRDAGDEPELHLFGKLKRIVTQWLEHHLECRGDTYEAQLLYLELADLACERIAAGITRAFQGERPLLAVLDPWVPFGSSRAVNFNSTKTDSAWETDPRRSHVNFVIYDSEWEAEFSRVAEDHPKVHSYVKNHGLNFEVPYLHAGASRTYLPDFIVRVDDGHGPDDLLNLIVEIKGYRGEEAKDKKTTMEVYWIPGVNNLKVHGRWAFCELTELFEVEADFKAKVAESFSQMIVTATHPSS